MQIPWGNPASVRSRLAPRRSGQAPLWFSCPRSSVAERAGSNGLRASSSLAGGAAFSPSRLRCRAHVKRRARGSPSETEKERTHLSVSSSWPRTLASHAGNRGSNPLTDAKIAHAARLDEQRSTEPKVGGSSPSVRAKCPRSSIGRTSPSGGEGCWFEPSRGRYGAGSARPRRGSGAPPTTPASRANPHGDAPRFRSGAEQRFHTPRTLVRVQQPGPLKLWRDLR